MPNYVYIAASTKLLDWSNETLGRSAMKVGISHDPSHREQTLAGRDPHKVRGFVSCAGYDDWKVLTHVEVSTETEAKNLEDRFKASVEMLDYDSRQLLPFMTPTRHAGESEIFLLPEERLPWVDLAQFDDDVRYLYLGGRSHMYEAVRGETQPTERYIDDEERKFIREFDQHLLDQDSTRAENRDRADRLREHGFYYGDED